MQHIQIAGVLAFTISMFICLCYTTNMDKKDKNFASERLDIKWEDLDNVCIDYLNAISQYPHWRMCFIAALISSLLFFSSYACIHKNIKFENLVATAIICFLINMVCFIKVIDYFRWHIMCQGDKGWGCMNKKSLSKKKRDE